MLNRGEFAIRHRVSFLAEIVFAYILTVRIGIERFTHSRRPSNFIAQ